MTIQLADQAEWLEVDEQGSTVTWVTTIAPANPQGIVLLGGSQDRPEDWQSNIDYIAFQLPPIEPKEVQDFETEYEAFRKLLPTLMTTYEGQYVAIHHGAVVDADRSRSTLVHRFFERFGDVSVYIGYVGDASISYQVTPFLF